MKKFAVDIVLLPPKKITDLCIKVNKQDPKRNLALNAKDHLPHISVLIGVINESDIKKINIILRQITKKYLPINLEIFDYLFGMNGKIKIGSFNIRLSKDIMNLQQQIAEQLKPYLTNNDAQKSMFYDKDIRPDSLNWVKTFPKAELGKNYKPHITLQTANPKYDKLPIKFSASRLVLCHLGHFCTCRKILK